MDKAIEVLNDAGLHVVFTPPGLRQERVYYAAIHSDKYTNGERIEEYWQGRGASIEEAFKAAGAKLQQHMRPVYENYLVLAEAFDWTEEA